MGHIVPVDRGGTELPGNLVALCAACRRGLPRARHELGDEPSTLRSTATGEGTPQLGLFS